MPGPPRPGGTPPSSTGYGSAPPSGAFQLPGAAGPHPPFPGPAMPRPSGPPSTGAPGMPGAPGGMMGPGSVPPGGMGFPSAQYQAPGSMPMGPPGSMGPGMPRPLGPPMANGGPPPGPMGGPMPGGPRPPMPGFMPSGPPGMARPIGAGPPGGPPNPYGPPMPSGPPSSSSMGVGGVGAPPPFPGAPPGGGMMPGGGPMPTRQATAARIDPAQIPRPVASQQEVVTFETRLGGQHAPPPSSISHFIVRDRGNASPRFMRCSLNAVPATVDLLNQSGMSFGVMVQPLALPDPQDDPVMVRMGGGMQYVSSGAGIQITQHMLVRQGCLLGCSAPGCLVSDPPMMRGWSFEM